VQQLQLVQLGMNSHLRQHGEGHFKPTNESIYAEFSCTANASIVQAVCKQNRGVCGLHG
jgi:hypothetical protein